MKRNTSNSLNKRPPRAVLTPEEIIERMESFSERREQFRDAALKEAPSAKRTPRGAMTRSVAIKKVKTFSKRKEQFLATARTGKS